LQVTLLAKDSALHDAADGTQKGSGLSIEQVDAALKKHEAFEKVVQAQDEKFTSLQVHGEKLVQQSHFDSANIAKKMDEVERQRRRIKELTAHRRNRLEQLFLDAQFNRDVDEAQLWIAEKLKSLESPDLRAENVTSLEDKVKKLKKHQAVLAEIRSHEPRMKQIMDNGTRLLANSVDGSTDVKRNLEQLHAAWKALLRLSRTLSKGFEEAQDILDFNSHVEKAESWIKEKVLVRKNH
jgi:spectrin beta